MCTSDATSAPPATSAESLYHGALTVALTVPDAQPPATSAESLYRGTVTVTVPDAQRSAPVRHPRRKRTRRVVRLRVAALATARSREPPYILSPSVIGARY
eukprot:797608-Pyramimonas_sp.AAC.1